MRHRVQGRIYHEANGAAARAPTNFTKLGGPTTTTTKLTCSELLIFRCDFFFIVTFRYRPPKDRLNFSSINMFKF